MALGSKNPILVDRRVYAFKGKWKSPNNDISESIFYFISNKPTLTTRYINGKETIEQVIEITCYGEHAFAIEDEIVLQTGERFMIDGIANNYFEPNIAVRDMLKQRIESQILVLK